MLNNYIALVENGSTLLLQPDSDYLLDDSEIEYLKSLDHDVAVCELLERYLCNGWNVVEGAMFGGLILESPNDKAYYDNFYAIRSCLDALLEGKSYTFYLWE